MPKNTNRMSRINEELMKEISNIINYELKDPHKTGLISVTKVITTPDLRYARVYVSMINVKSQKQTLAILKKSAGFIRSELARKVNLRYTPELVFLFDDSIEYGAKIDSIISNITKDLKNKNEDNNEDM